MDDRQKPLAGAPKPDADKDKTLRTSAKDTSWGTVQPRAYCDIIDDTLDDSFPASDPPSWTGH